MGRTLRQRQRKDRESWSRSLASDPSFIILTKWLSSHGWKPTCRLMPAKFPNTGRGLMAGCSVTEGDVIVSIPSSLLITTASIKDTEIGHVLSKSKGEMFISQQVLAVFLAWELHLGKSSTWEKYISTLPTSFSTPNYLGGALFEVLPQFIQEPIRCSQNKARESYEHILSCVQSYQCTHCSLFAEEIISWEKYLWGWCCVNTRAVYIQPHLIPSHDLRIKDLDCLALAPFLDMFNHTLSAKVEAGLNTKNGCYEIRTLVPFHKYDEVFINYGPHSSVKLFVEYGFILPCNPHDSIPLTLEQILIAVKTTNECIVSEWDKRCFMEKHGLFSEMSVSVNGLSWNASVVISILLSESTHFKRWESIAYSQQEESSVPGGLLFSRVALTLLNSLKHQLHKCLENISVLQFPYQKECNNIHEHAPAPFLACCELIHQLITIIDSALQSVAENSNSLID